MVEKEGRNLLLVASCARPWASVKGTVTNRPHSSSPGASGLLLPEKSSGLANSMDFTESFYVFFHIMTLEGSEGLLLPPF